MRKEKLFATGSVLLASAELLAACGSSSSKSSSSSKAQKLSWTEAAELTTMDPSKATDRYDADQFNNVMEGLIRLGNNAKPTPGIAKSWKESSDGKTWTFNLRKGVNGPTGMKLPPRTSSTPGEERSTQRLLLNTPTCSPASRTLTRSLPARRQSTLWASRLTASTS